MNKKTKKRLQQIIGFIVALVILYFVIARFIKYWDDISMVLSKANWFMMLIGVLVMGSGVASITFIWQRAMKVMYDKSVPFYCGLTMIFLPNITRYIPGKFWFIFGIMYFAKKWKIDTASAFTVSFIAHLFFLISGVILGILLVGFGNFISIPIWMILILLIISVIILRPALIHKLLQIALKFAGKQDEYSRMPVMKPSLIIFSIAVGFGMWLMMGLGIMICTKSVYPDFQWQNYLSITGAFSFSWIIGYISIITPAGLGVREGVMMYSLPSIIPEAQRVFLSLATRVWMMFSEAILLTAIILILFIKNELKFNKNQNNLSIENGLSEELENE